MNGCAPDLGSKPGKETPGLFLSGPGSQVVGNLRALVERRNPAGVVVWTGLVSFPEFPESELRLKR